MQQAEDSPATLCTTPVLHHKEEVSTPRQASTQGEISTQGEVRSTQQEGLSTLALEQANTVVEASTTEDQDSHRVAQAMGQADRIRVALTKTEDPTAAVMTFLKPPTAPTGQKTEANDAYPNASLRKEPR